MAALAVNKAGAGPDGSRGASNNRGPTGTAVKVRRAARCSAFSDLRSASTRSGERPSEGSPGRRGFPETVGAGKPLREGLAAFPSHCGTPVSGFEAGGGQVAAVP